MTLRTKHFRENSSTSDKTSGSRMTRDGMTLSHSQRAVKGIGREWAWAEIRQFCLMSWAMQQTWKWTHISTGLKYTYRLALAKIMNSSIVAARRLMQDINSQKIPWLIPCTVCSSTRWFDDLWLLLRQNRSTVFCHLCRYYNCYKTYQQQQKAGSRWCRAVSCRRNYN